VKSGGAPAPERGTKGAERGGTYARIRAVVARVPRGHVVTYGQVARLAGMPGHARLVGYALSALPERSSVPWHRVVNARGLVSERAEGAGGHDALQRVILRREGIRIDRRGAISLEEFQWRPRSATAPLRRPRETPAPTRCARTPASSSDPAVD
jgi:methylated-DNA-protein-cysteine methyltransferase related protein